MSPDLTNPVQHVNKTLEEVSDADIYAIYHPKRNKRGLHASLASPAMNELNSIFQDIAEIWNVNMPGGYRVDPHAQTDMAGLGGVWRLMGCGDALDVSCSPQRVSRWRYVGHEREHQSANLILNAQKFALSTRNVYAGQATKLLFEENNAEGQGDDIDMPRPVKAVGVQFYDKKLKKLRNLRAKKEVIVAAGVVNTPKLLMHSGIGDALELNALGIPLVKDIPDVGLHLQEHVGVSAVAGTNIKCPFEAHRDEHGKPKGGTHLGFLNDFHAQFYGFYNLPETDVWFELLLIEGCLDEKYSLTFTTILMTPKNEGRVVLNSEMLILLC